MEWKHKTNLLPQLALSPLLLKSERPKKQSAYRLWSQLVHSISTTSVDSRIKPRIWLGTDCEYHELSDQNFSFFSGSSLDFIDLLSDAKHSFDLLYAGAAGTDSDRHQTSFTRGLEVSRDWLLHQFESYRNDFQTPKNLSAYSILLEEKLGKVRKIETEPFLCFHHLADLVGILQRQKSEIVDLGILEIPSPFVAYCLRTQNSDKKRKCESYGVRFEHDRMGRKSIERILETLSARLQVDLDQISNIRIVTKSFGLFVLASEFLPSQVLDRFSFIEGFSMEKSVYESLKDAESSLLLDFSQLPYVAAFYFEKETQIDI